MELNKRYEDTISGFRGTAIGLAEYLNGAKQVQLEALATPGGQRRKEWFDECRIKPLEDTEPPGDYR